MFSRDKFNIWAVQFCTRMLEISLLYRFPFGAHPSICHLGLRCQKTWTLNLCHVSFCEFSTLLLHAEVCKFRKKLLLQTFCTYCVWLVTANESPLLCRRQAGTIHQKSDVCLKKSSWAGRLMLSLLSLWWVSVTAGIRRPRQRGLKWALYEVGQNRSLTAEPQRPVLTFWKIQDAKKKKSLQCFLC